jgi:hypothetical protein
MWTATLATNTHVIKKIVPTLRMLSSAFSRLGSGRCDESISAVTHGTLRTIVPTHLSFSAPDLLFPNLILMRFALDTFITPGF